MKTKGITIWERYLEHFVLGIAVLILVGFSAMQFIGSPNSVEVSGIGKVGPGQIDQLLEERAASIAQRIDGPPETMSPPKPVLDLFEELRVATISPKPTLAWMAPKVSPVAGMTMTPANTPFVVPEIPAPHSLIAKQYFDTLSQETVVEFADLKRVLPAAPPYDITWMTPAAKFDVAAVRRQFGEPGPNGEAPLPMKWYHDRVEFIDVRIEREELVSGKWVRSTLLEPIPGQVSARPMLASRIDAATRDEILATVADASVILQPEFYAGVAAAWQPPDHDNAEQAIIDIANVEDAELHNLRLRLERMRRALERVEAKMKELNCPDQPPAPQQPPRPPTSPRAGGSGTPAPGSGGDFTSGGGPNRGAGDQAGPKNEGECRRLRTQRDRFRQEIAKIQEQIEKLAPAEPEVQQPQQVVSDEPELQDEYVVWGHDIQIEPGKTYRYRFTIEIYNPLFARRNDLIPAQHDMAEKFTLASATSEWSEPVRAEPPLRLFITEARPAGHGVAIGGANLGSATAEVYRFRDGRWWSERFTVQPGERIGRTRPKPNDRSTQIDFATEWFVLDVVADIAAEREELDRAWAATVFLQNLSDAAITQVRLPRDDFRSSERSFLRQEVDATGGALVAR